MARHLDGYVWCEWRRARPRVAEMSIKRRKRRAWADDAQIDRPTSRRPKIILRGVHQFPPQTRALASQLDPQQSKMPAFAPQLDIDAAGKLPRIFRNKKFSFLHIRANTRWIDALPFDERLLHHKRRID